MRFAFPKLAWEQMYPRIEKMEDPTHPAHLMFVALGHEKEDEDNGKGKGKGKAKASDSATAGESSGKKAGQSSSTSLSLQVTERGRKRLFDQLNKILAEDVEIKAPGAKKQKK